MDNMLNFSLMINRYVDTSKFRKMILSIDSMSNYFNFKDNLC